MPQAAFLGGLISAVAGCAMEADLATHTDDVELAQAAPCNEVSTTKTCPPAPANRGCSDFVQDASDPDRLFARNDPLRGSTFDRSDIGLTFRTLDVTLDIRNGRVLITSFSPTDRVYDGNPPRAVLCRFMAIVAHCFNEKEQRGIVEVAASGPYPHFTLAMLDAVANSGFAQFGRVTSRAFSFRTFPYSCTNAVNCVYTVNTP